MVITYELKISPAPAPCSPREERQQLKQELEREINKINKDIDRNKTRLEGLEQREREIQQIIDNAKDVRGSLEKLERARQKLKELDRLQHEVSPLLQRRNQLF
uniref:hypothetical protein n=1 Tax=Anaplasma marginale TaxID=770 RepID=UPI0005B3CBB2